MIFQNILNIDLTFKWNNNTIYKYSTYYTSIRTYNLINIMDLVKEIKY